MQGHRTFDGTSRIAPETNSPHSSNIFLAGGVSLSRITTMVKSCNTTYLILVQMFDSLIFVNSSN